MSGGFSNKQNTGAGLTADELLWLQTAEAGVILLNETAAPSSSADIGKLYVKSDGKLYFKDENNIEYDLLVGGTGFTALPATGTVNSVNAEFTFSEKPDYIISDGVWYRENKGWTWNAGLLKATMTIPPNDDIYGFT